MKLTFKYDVQLNDNEDYIKEGTVVEISSNPFYVNRFEDSTPVIITEAYSYEGEKIKFPATVEWFMNSSLIEYNRKGE